VKDQITTDFAPLLDQVAATAPDLLFICSYLSDSIALVRAINAWKFNGKTGHSRCHYKRSTHNMKILTIIARIQRASMLNRHSDSKNMILGNFRKRA